MSVSMPSFFPRELVEMTLGYVHERDVDASIRLGDGWAAGAKDAHTLADQNDALIARAEASGSADSVNVLVAHQKQLSEDLRTSAQRCDSLARQCYDAAYASELNTLIIIASGIALLLQLAVDALMLGWGALKAAADRAAAETAMAAASRAAAAKIIASGAQHAARRSTMHPVAKFAMIGAGMGGAFGGVTHYGAQAWQKYALHHRDEIDWAPIGQNTLIGAVAGAAGAGAAMRAAPLAGKLIDRTVTRAGRVTATVGGTVLVGGAAGLVGGVVGAVGGLAFGAPLTWKDLKAAIVTGVASGVAGTLVQGVGAARSATAKLPTAPHGEPTHSTLIEQARAMSPEDLSATINERNHEASTLLATFGDGGIPVQPHDAIRIARDLNVLASEQAHRLLRTPLPEGRLAMNHADLVQATATLADLAPQVRVMHEAASNAATLAGIFPATPELQTIYGWPDQTAAAQHFLSRAVDSIALDANDLLAGNISNAIGAIRGLAEHHDLSLTLDRYLEARWQTPVDANLADSMYHSYEAANIMARYSSDYPIELTRDMAVRFLPHLQAVAEFYGTRALDVTKTVATLGELSRALNIAQARIGVADPALSPVGALRRQLADLVGHNDHLHRAAMSAATTAGLPAVNRAISDVIAQLNIAVDLDTPQPVVADAVPRTPGDLVAEFRQDGIVPAELMLRAGQERQGQMWDLTERLANTTQDPPADLAALLPDARQLQAAVDDIYNLAGVLNAVPDPTTLLHMFPDHVRGLVSALERNATADAMTHLAQLDSYLSHPGRGEMTFDGYLTPGQPDMHLQRHIASATSALGLDPVTLRSENRNFAQHAQSRLTSLLAAGEYFTTRSTDNATALRVLAEAEQLFAQIAHRVDPQSPVPPLFGRLLATLHGADPTLMRDIGISAFDRDSRMTETVTGTLDRLAELAVTDPDGLPVPPPPTRELPTPEMLLPEYYDGLADPVERAYLERFAANERNTAALASELGIPVEQLQHQMRAELHQAFAHPVATRVEASTLAKILQDGRFKSMFELEPGHHTTIMHSVWEQMTASRGLRESALFGYPLDLAPDQRPIYAYVRFAEHPAPNDKLLGHGDIEVIFRDTVRVRTTANIGGTNDVSAIPSPINDPRPESFAASPSTPAGFSYFGITGIGRDYASPEFRRDSFIEAQIHGGVSIHDIAEVVFRRTPSPTLEAALADAGIPWRMA